MNKIKNAWKIRKLKQDLEKINQLAEKMSSLADEELQAETESFRRRLADGISESELLPEAYAAMREAMKRRIGIYLYDVQILGALALYEGMIAEMKTGEGKTFTAVLPLYMNALTGRSTILMTTNEYLARRDGTMLGPLYEWMGLSCTIGVPDRPGKRMKSREKKRIYAADIVYTTNGTLGFDYLLENLLSSREDRYLRPFDFVIVDEADAVLLDAAQTPLVISGMPKVQSNLYDSVDFFVTTLKDEDYQIKEKDVWLTDSGIKKAEKFFEIRDLYSGRYYEFVRHIMLALRAHHIFRKDRHYVVEDEEIKLLDINTGRILDKTKMQAGQHQAIEAKEHVKHTNVHRAMASITYQDFFRLFPRVAGMTGTALVNEAEFLEIYGMETVGIPTNRPVIRIDEKTRYFTTLEAELYGVMEYLLDIHRTGRPVLVVTETIAVTEIISELLLEAEIPHNVLNAHHVAKEALMIAEAGRVGAVTVATSVAGRGTDIKLEDGAASLGGLAVIGVGRMPNRSLEEQARGRAGRQGDPGSSIFFVSLEDKVVQEHGREKLQRYTLEDRELFSRRIRREIARAQRISAEKERGARRSTMEYGESMRRQRELVYQTRRQIQEIDAFSVQELMKIEQEVIREYVDAHREKAGRQKLRRYVLDQISYHPVRFPDERDVDTPEQVERYLRETAYVQLMEKLRQLGTEKMQTEYLRNMILKAVDEAWIEEVDYMQQLKNTMESRQYTQRNMLYEYHLEVSRSYDYMRRRVKQQMMRNILLGEIRFDKEGNLEMIMP
ncbi:MAG: accessory Sec system translocase SecA2 [Eubacteriales bacterium]|nr:accessory Sec system translocase SecA2 [Eubacteriales bacterium]